MPSPRLSHPKAPAILSHLPAVHPSGRKRVREAIANGGLRDTVMGDEEDEEYFDVEMDTDVPTFPASSSSSAPEASGTFVPFYSHFGGSDFDDE